MRRRSVLVGLVLLILSAVVYAQLRDKTPTSPGAYRVTDWPASGGADQSYAREVEEHLNKMSADGWRYHSELVGQFGKLMIFERSAQR